MQTVTNPPFSVVFSIHGTAGPGFTPGRVLRAIRTSEGVRNGKECGVSNEGH